MKNPVVYSKIESCLAEGWEVEDKTVWAYGKSFPLADPIAIHLKTYRTDESHQTRYNAMRRAFELIWPKQVATYNYWMERIFWEHCDFNTDIFSLAGGGGIGKTQGMAYTGSIFYLARPHERAVVVTSTTLASLKKRIYGFILRALDEATYKPQLRISNSPPPTISLEPPDFIHGIFGIAAKEGTDEKAIQDIIGHHPKNAFMLILDEAPDMPVAIMNAIPNMKKSLEDRFQAIAIGNPHSTDDLHGSLSTPKVGWENINPDRDFRWATTQHNGYCLYFNPYDSPAIHETDPIKKAALSKFLITEEKLIEAEQNEGKDSDGFMRFTMGYWRTRSTNATVVSEEFLKDYDPTKQSEFSGLHEVNFCAGLDPAFTSGGDKCILRLGVLGQHVTGKIILDFRGTSLIFPIKIRSKTGQSAEIQIATQVIEILKSYKVPLNTLCVDASGQGRGIADVIQLQSGTALTPTKIYSTNISDTKKKRFDTLMENELTTSAYDMWFTGRQFIAQQQIFGLDTLAYAQLHNRRFIEKNKKKTLEPKGEYKKRMAAISSLLGRSPDEADAAMLCIQAAIIHHGFFVGQEKTITRYADETSRRFAMALQSYKQEMVKAHTKNPLTASYSRGLDSILKKKAF